MLKSRRLLGARCSSSPCGWNITTSSKSCFLDREQSKPVVCRAEAEGNSPLFAKAIQRCEQMALDDISIFLFVLPSPLSNLCSEGWAKIVFQAWRWFFFTRQIIRQMLVKIRIDLRIKEFSHLRRTKGMNQKGNSRQKIGTKPAVSLLKLHLKMFVILINQIICIWYILINQIVCFWQV